MVWKNEYEKKNLPAAEIVEKIKSGWTCCTDMAGAIPSALMKALGERAKEGRVENVKLHMALDVTQMNILEPDANQGITPVSWFSGKGLSGVANDGRGDIMPCYYRDMPELFRKYVDIDVFLATVSPMDQHGYFSIGTNGSYSGGIMAKARHIYVEVNRNMPRSLVGPKIHISEVEALCEHDCPLPLVSPSVIDPVSEKIGQFIAAEVPNGATIQLGIGAVPDAVGNSLKEKRNLGIHTELFTDSMVELIECGAVTNMQKPIHRGKTVATLAFGSKRIYDYIDNNPSFEIHPVDYVNNPVVIAQHPDFISVNAALEVDFFGQVCAESIGTMHISGSGGQADYVRGAVMSRGGKSFIAFPSTARKGTVSRIRPVLSEGSIVTTSKNDVDYIVTEYGAAKLRGKTLSERTKELIQIAHPKFREELTFLAKQRNIII